MKQREQALLFIKKACQDEALLAQIVFSSTQKGSTGNTSQVFPSI